MNNENHPSFQFLFENYISKKQNEPCRSIHAQRNCKNRGTLRVCIQKSESNVQRSFLFLMFLLFLFQTLFLADLGDNNLSEISSKDFLSKY